jgi:hypothetical protein
MEKKRGFLLIEALVGLAVSCWVMILMYSAVVLVNQRATDLYRQAFREAALFVGCRQLARDLQQAQSVVYARDSSFLIKTINNNYVQWFVDGQKLFRKIGFFRVDAQAWETSFTSLVGLGVSRFASENIFSLGHVALRVSVICEGATFKHTYCSRIGVVA